MWDMLRTPGEWPVGGVRTHKAQDLPNLVLCALHVQIFLRSRFSSSTTSRAFSPHPLVGSPLLLLQSSSSIHPSIISMSSKVFVGNLSFKTETEALREHFSAAGTVTEANIITRGPRSLGYGFVDFKTPADAENAVKLFNQKEIDGRVVNVEVAHPRQEESAANGGEKAAGAAADGTRPPRARRGRGGRPQTAEGEGAPQPREGGRRFRPRQTDGAEGAEGEAVEGGRRRGYSGAAPGAPRGTGFAPRGRGGARRGAPRTNPDGTPVAAGAPGSPKPAGERAPRPFRERKPREPQAPRPQRPKYAIVISALFLSFQFLLLHHPSTISLYKFWNPPSCETPLHTVGARNLRSRII